MSHEHDPEFERLLAESEDLFKRYRALPKAEPAREIDVAILAKAREAVAKPKPARARWLLPISSVATIALAAGIGWRVHVSNQSTMDATSKPAAAEPAEQIIEFELIDIPNRDEERKEMANSPPEPVMAPAPAVAAPAAPAAASMPPPMDVAQPVAESVPTEALASEEALADQVAPMRQQKSVYSEPHTRADHGNLGEPPETDKRKAEMSLGGSRRANELVGAAGPAGNDDLAKRDRNADLTADERVEKIRELARRRRFHEVRKEIAELQRLFPSYPLPDDIAKMAR